MRARSKGRQPGSKKADLPGDSKEPICLRVYRWLEAEATMLGGENRRKLKATKAPTRKQADGEQWPEVLRRPQQG